MKVEDMKEMNQATKEAQWKSDKDIPSCTGCSKEFSISRRKVSALLVIKFFTF